MSFLGEASRFIHVLFGFVGLAAFWIPVFSRKGANLHVRTGKVFVWCAYIVLAAAAAALLVRSLRMAGEGMTFGSHPDAWGFVIFLGYLSFVTFVTVRHGMGVLRHKMDPAALRTPLTVFLARASIAASVGVIAYAIIVDPQIKLILFALSPIGFANGFGILRYTAGNTISKRAWMYEHLGGMLGAGIAFHTAFAVFGLNQMFDLGLSGFLAVIPWVAPAAIGIPAISIWTRHYRRKFGEI